jgi:hypothetical protein
VILSDLCSYLAGSGRAALPDLARSFDTDAEVMRAMLDTLVRKGWVRRIAPGPGCPSGCRKCGSGTTEIFEWTGPVQGANRAGQDSCGQSDDALRLVSSAPAGS